MHFLFREYVLDVIHDIGKEKEQTEVDKLKKKTVY